MKSILIKIIVGVIFWVIRSYQIKSAELARIETARLILDSSNMLRISLQAFAGLLILVAIIGAGATVLVTGLSFFAVIFFFARESASGLYWLPLGLCIGGVISLLPPAIFIFCYLLSEETWMELTRKIPYCGKIVDDVLNEIRKKKNS